MRLNLVLSASLGLVLLGLASSAHAGDLYYDGCPADRNITLQTNLGTTALGDASYYTRPFCPWFLIDVQGQQSLAGRELRFWAGWDVPQPYDKIGCESLHASYIVSKDLGGTLYEVVARDEMVGEWDGGFCAWRRLSGQSELIFTGTNSRYRLLVRAEAFYSPAPVFGWAFTP